MNPAGLTSPSRKRSLIVVVLALLLLAALVLWWMGHGRESTDDATIEGRVVAISPKVPGYITALNVEDNQLVKAGDVLLEIDPRDYQFARDRAAASLDAAKAKLAASQANLKTTRISAPSTLESAKSQVDAAQANWDRAKADLARLQQLSDAARSRAQLDEATAAERAARSTLIDTQARQRSAATVPNTLASAEATTGELAAQVKLAEAELAQAELNLAYTKILAPSDGRIARRQIEAGAYVQPGQSLFAVVQPEVWVVANFKETQLTHMRPGQSVDIEIDAFPKEHFTGKVDSIQSGTGARFSLFPPENATGNFVKIVQRVPVKITFDQLPDASLPISPGMSVVPKVHVNE